MDERPVEAFLRSANVLQGFSGITRRFCWALFVLMSACLAAIGIDAIFALPAWPRLVINGILLFTGLTAAAGLWRTVRSFRFNQRKAARRAELVLGIDDNTFINAVDLGDGSAGLTSATLRKQAITFGETLSRRFSFLETVQFGPMLLACLALLTLGVATLATWILHPPLFNRVIPRYLDVFGDHPAYTSLVFNVQVNPDPIYQGQSAVIEVGIEGIELPSDANLLQHFDQHPVSTPMLNTEPGKFQLELHDIQSNMEFVVETEAGISDPFTVDVMAVPLFDKTWLTYQYPEYTGWPAKRQRLDSRGITALFGTQVKVEIESNNGLDSGKLTTRLKQPKIAVAEASEKPDATESTTLAARVESPNAVTGQLQLTQQSSFEISLRGTNGSISPHPLTGPVVVKPDRPPRIHFVAPDPHIIAVEDRQIPVQLHFSDDVGLKQVDFFRSVNGLGPYPRPIVGKYRNRTAGEAQYEFDLADLGARAGDVITYYATVSDNYPVDWSNHEDHNSTTDTFVIQVISLQQYKELARQHYRMDEVLDEIQKLKRELEQPGASRRDQDVS